jgi:hypothetical protein
MSKYIEHISKSEDTFLKLIKSNEVFILSIFFKSLSIELYLLYITIIKITDVNNNEFINLVVTGIKLKIIKRTVTNNIIYIICVLLSKSVNLLYNSKKLLLDIYILIIDTKVLF